MSDDYEHLKAQKDAIHSKQQAESFATRIQEALEQQDADLLDILGRPNFLCGEMASLLRHNGHDIPTKSEVEQAHVIGYLLQIWLKDPVGWRETAAQEFKKMITAMGQSLKDG